MRALLLNVNANTLAEVNPKGLHDYYSLINCSTIDIVSRKIKGKWFDIICDDEGTFVDDPKISAIDDMGKPMLVGNLIITVQADSEGELTDLTDADIEHIKANVRMMETNKHPEGILMLCQCGC